MHRSLALLCHVTDYSCETNGLQRIESARGRQRIRTTDAPLVVTRHIHHEKLKIMMSPLSSQLEKCLSLRKSLFQEAGGCVESDPASPTLKQDTARWASFHLSNGSFFSCILARSSKSRFGATRATTVSYA